MGPFGNNSLHMNRILVIDMEIDSNFDCKKVEMSGVDFGGYDTLPIVMCGINSFSSIGKPSFSRDTLISDTKLFNFFIAPVIPSHKTRGRLGTGKQPVPYFSQLF